MRGSCEIYRYDSVRGNKDEMLTGGIGIEGSARTQIGNFSFKFLIMIVFPGAVYVLVHKD